MKNNIKREDSPKRKEKEQKAIPPSVRRVLTLRTELIKMTDGIDESLGLLLEEKEKEFIEAFKEKISQAHKELKVLKEKVKEHEMEQKYNYTTKKIQNQRDFYKGEVEKYSKSNETLKRLILYIYINKQ